MERIRTYYRSTKPTDANFYYCYWFLYYLKHYCCKLNCFRRKSWRNGSLLLNVLSESWSNHYTIWLLKSSVFRWLRFVLHYKVVCVLSYWIDYIVGTMKMYVLCWISVFSNNEKRYLIHESNDKAIRISRSL